MATGASAIIFLDHKGKIIIKRDYRGDVPANISERFQKKVLDVEEQFLTPVFTDMGLTYVWVKHNNIYGTCRVSMGSGGGGSRQPERPHDPVLLAEAGRGARGILRRT